MLQHSKKNEKLQPNTFVDGIHVKISEQYKPPKKIILPVSCQNCTLGEVLYAEYDFRLEQNILNKLAEWKSARKEQVERRKEKFKTEKKVCEENFSNVSVDSTQNEGVEQPSPPPPPQQQQQQQISPKLTDSVLTPICAKQNSPSNKPVPNFNFSDFESDNSSPFDNMELKTINDMEVLASILSTNNMEQSIHNNNNNNNNNNNIIDKDVGKNCLALNNKNNEWGYTHTNGYNITYSNTDYNHTVVPSLLKDFNQFGFYPISEHIQISNYGLNDFSNQFGAAVPLDHTGTIVSKQDSDILGNNEPCSVNYLVPDEEYSRCVPHIMLELEKELKENKEREKENERKYKLLYLKETIMNSGFKNNKELPESSRQIQDGSALISKLPDPMSSLSPSSQKLVRYISEMGFPLSRVARACEMFQSNDKKIVEFLLQVQSLEEKKYPGDLIEKALVINNFKLNDSLKYLEAMVVLLDLGFDEEKAEEALIAANSDRDKALDMLIS